MGKIRIGVIGVGHLGRAHVRVLSEMNSCELVGCFDILTDKARKAAEEFGTKAFASARELIESCDALSLVAPTTEHNVCALEILESGRHVFIEKPIASNVEQADEIISLAESRGVKLMVGHIERFNPALKSLRDRITYPSFIEAHRLAPFNPRGLDVAVIHDLMIHDIDLCLQLTNSEVIDIQASAAAIVSEKMDIANARLTFESGCTANLTASRISPNAMRKLRVFQPYGYISFDFREPSAEIYSLIEDGASGETADGVFSMPFGETGKRIVYEKPKIRAYDMLTAELESFVESIETGAPVPVTGEDARTALQIASDIESRARAGLDNLRSHFK